MMSIMVLEIYLYKYLRAPLKIVAMKRPKNPGIYTNLSSTKKGRISSIFLI